MNLIIIIIYFSYNRLPDLIRLILLRFTSLIQCKVINQTYDKILIFLFLFSNGIKPV